MFPPAGLNVFVAKLNSAEPLPRECENIILTHKYTFLGRDVKILHSSKSISNTSKLQRVEKYAVVVRAKILRVHCLTVAYHYIACDGLILSAAIVVVFRNFCIQIQGII
ncbi:hypothetical protein GQX74_012374 [Glossina fuscipes]|nr:hypothetical protein GQX74_012374 [Glossina fuscipes]